MPTLKFRANSKQSLTDAFNDCVDFWVQHKYCQITITDKRSISANALQHEWYKIIAQHTGSDESEVKAFCKYRFGMPILLRRDLDLADFLKSVNWNYYSMRWNMTTEDAKQYYVSKMQVTSTFSTEESIEYMDAIKRHCMSEGLTLPSKKDY